MKGLAHMWDSLQTLRVASYNMMHFETNINELRRRFPYANPHAFSHRPSKVAAKIAAANADLVCLQEFSEDKFQAPATYNVRVGDIASGQYNSCAILYRSDKVRLLNSYHARIGNLIDKYLPSLKQGNPDLVHKLGSRDENILLCTFQTQMHGTVVHVATTHLFWNPIFPDVKLIQSFLVAREIEAFAASYHPEGAIILAGDFNSTPFYKPENPLEVTGPSSAVYQLLTEGIVDSKHAEHPARYRNEVAWKDSISCEPFKSAYKQVLGAEPAFTNYTGGFKGCLDYIFYRGALAPHEVGPLPSEAHLRSEVALPNSSEPSDHLPISAGFVLV